MKKYILAGAVVLLFGFYALWGKLNSNSNTSTPPITTNTGDTPSPTPTPAPTPNPTSTVAYKNGSYTGKVTDAFYGPMQVKAVISGGKLTDVVFIQYPNDRPESIEVNNASNPLLKGEAIKAQSANVDIVSGATQSSEAFQKSLADALSKAK